MNTNPTALYSKILVPVENSSTDAVILDHIKPLARLCRSKILLVHVADGFVARNQEKLNLSDSQEIEDDRNYLARLNAELSSEGFEVGSELLRGEPADEILSIASAQHCDLIAMATHGHKLIGDLILGSVAEKIRHRTDLPVLMIKAPKE
ncbi:MAG: universal stress protein [Oligoflexia bacterium]|nr:universal stress protein [Oligoflexia bacterium]